MEAPRLLKKKLRIIEVESLRCMFRSMAFIATDFPDPGDPFSQKSLWCESPSWLLHQALKWGSSNSQFRVLTCGSGTFDSLNPICGKERLWRHAGNVSACLLPKHVNKYPHPFGPHHIGCACFFASLYRCDVRSMIRRVERSRSMKGQCIFKSDLQTDHLELLSSFCESYCVRTHSWNLHHS